MLHVRARAGRLVPVRVEDVPPAEMPAVLRPLVFCDLFGVDAEEARRVLLEAVQGPRRPDGEPVFPGEGTAGASRKLGGRDRGCRVPCRGCGTSRPAILGSPAGTGCWWRCASGCWPGTRAVVQAFQGMGGVGKTQLAAEYAYRFAGAYDLAWWIDAEQPGLIGDQFAALGSALGCAQPDARRRRRCGQRCWASCGSEAVAAGVRNAEEPADITGWLPGGGGHVLITSRERRVGARSPRRSRWTCWPGPNQSRSCRAGSPGSATADADELAAQLGDLPLAIAQAAGFIAETGTPAAEYLELLRPRPGSSWIRARARLSADAGRGDPADRRAAGPRTTRPPPSWPSMCAFLAPEPVPEDLFTGAAGRTA